MPDIKLTGVKQLDEVLKNMPRSMQNKALRRGTREATKVVLRDARRLAPRDSGALERSLKVRALKRSRRNKSRVGASVVTDGAHKLFSGEQFYGAFVELGTAKMDADPFLRPALWSNKDSIRRAYIVAIKRWIAEKGFKRVSGSGTHSSFFIEGRS